MLRGYVLRVVAIVKRIGCVQRHVFITIVVERFAFVRSHTYVVFCDDMSVHSSAAVVRGRTRRAQAVRMRCELERLDSSALRRRMEVIRPRARSNCRLVCFSRLIAVLFWSLLMTMTIAVGVMRCSSTTAAERAPSATSTTITAHTRSDHKRTNE
jgi:hypothetical protein